MIALDTNVIVRVVTQDDAEQARAAVEVMREPDLFVSKTVLLETAWVLSYTYGLGREAVGSALEGVVGYPNATIEDRGAVLLALAWYARGMDVADAMHLASARHTTELATFDRKLASSARRLPGTPPVRLIGGSGAD